MYSNPVNALWTSRSLLLSWTAVHEQAAEIIDLLASRLANVLPELRAL